MIDKFLQFLSLVKKSNNLVEGYNKCEDLVKRSQVFLIIISEDASINTQEKFIRMCKDREIPTILKYNKEQIGKVIGRTEMKIIGITDKNMSLELLKINSGVN